MPIISKSYDIEILPNFFSITIVDISSYLEIFNDCYELDKKGKHIPIPLTQLFTVKEIKERLTKVKKINMYITDKNDSQLLYMIAELNNMQPFISINNTITRTDMFGYNSCNYDKLMIAAFLMLATTTNNTKELINKLYNTSKKIIELQNDRDAFYKDFYINTLFKYKLPYTDVDVMKIFALNKCGKGKDKDGNVVYFPKGLKQTSINLQWYELLEYDLPNISEKDIHLYNNIPTYKSLSASQINTLVDKWDRYIIDEWIPDMLYYNTNDVFIVCEIIRLNTDEIRSRYAISNAYNVNVLNSSRSNIADILFEKFYSEFSGLHPSQWKGKRTERTRLSFKKVIFPHITFKTKNLQDILNEMQNVVITSLGKDSFTKEVTINKLSYTLATGGLHTKDTPRELRSKLIFNDSFTGSCIEDIPKDKNIWDFLTNDSYIYVHWDITSFYPWIMAMYKVAPAHLDLNTFVRLITWLAETRINAKHDSNEYIDGILKSILVLVLKIVINSIYGKLGFERGDLYDKLAVLKVVINGQLMTLSLCEILELSGIEVISANTDGIVVKLYKKDKILFDDIASKWKTYNNLMADSEEYLYYINRDINNYFVKELNGEITYKGAFNPKMHLLDLQKGYDMPVVAQAVINYFDKGIPIMETFLNTKNILDFCKTQNVGRQFHVGYVAGGKHDILFEQFGVGNVYDTIEMQRYIRYFVSNNGGTLQKIHNTTGAISRLAAGQRITICNTLTDEPIYNRNINYKYYYTEAMKIIDPIKLGISPNQKGDSRNKTKSGKKLIKEHSEMYNKLFDDE